MRKLFLLFCCVFPLLGFAQNDFVVVDSVNFVGNKRTKAHIILREMSLQAGDTISLTALPEKLAENKKLILNTGLFSIVTMNVSRWDAENHIVIEATMQEQWYLYPYPIFELADRNFNVWWSEQNRDLSRVNLGMRLTHANFTGRRDKLRMVAQLGYTPKYELEYEIPAINKKQTIGAHTKVHYSTNKETNYITSQNKFVFHNSEEVLLKNLSLSLGFNYRPGLYYYHDISAEFNQSQASDSLATILNPDYFLEGRTQQQYFTLQYAFLIDKRDLRAYPMNGFYLKTILRKDGLGFFNDRDALTLNTSVAKYFPIAKKWNVELIWKGVFFLYQNKQPYYNSRSFGYRPDYLRGYELYVVDGMDFTYLKASLRLELFNRTINWGKIVPIPQFRLMPLRVYLSLNSDTGYVNDPHYSSENSFSNTWLWGGGLGLDIVSFNDKVWQIEYSFNHLWENGLFLHFKYKF